MKTSPLTAHWVPPGGLHAHSVPLMHRHYDDYRITLAVFDRPELECHGLEPFRRYSCHGFHRLQKDHQKVREVESRGGRGRVREEIHRPR